MTPIAPHLQARRNVEAFLSSTDVVHGPDLTCPLHDFVVALQAFQVTNDLPGPPKYKLHLMSRALRKYNLRCTHGIHTYLGRTRDRAYVVGADLRSASDASPAAEVTRKNSVDVFLSGAAVIHCADGCLPLEDFKAALRAFEVSHGLRPRKFDEPFFIGPFWKHGLRVEQANFRGMKIKVVMFQALAAAETDARHALRLWDDTVKNLNLPEQGAA